MFQSFLASSEPFIALDISFLFDTISLPPVLDFLVDIQDIKGKHFRTAIQAAPAHFRTALSHTTGQYKTIQVCLTVSLTSQVGYPS